MFISLCRNLLLASVTITLGAGPSQAQPWDSEAGFSCSQNPNGPWSYGQTDTIATGVFTLLAYNHTDGGQFAGCGWEVSADVSYPDVDRVQNGPMNQPMAVTLGNAPGIYAVLRWTAPQDGVYSVSAHLHGFWSRSQVAFPSGTGVLAIAGTIYDVGTFGELGEQEANRTIPGLSLAAGDTVDLYNYDGSRPVVRLIISTCPADFNNDGFIDFFDFNDFVTCFEGGDCPIGKTADFNNDGFADFFDFNDFVDAFESGC